MIDLKINCDTIKKDLIRFIQKHTYEKNISKCIVGVSGGIDSAVVLYMVAEAMGPENTWAIMLPDENTSPDDICDAEKIIKYTGVNVITQNISEYINLYFKDEDTVSPLRRYNKASRERMSILYDYSLKLDALVIGTSNKTETLLGYGAQYGDSSCAINPIGNLYKSQVWELGSFLNIPESIIKKKPSTNYWTDISENNKIECSYPLLDELLFNIFEKKVTHIELIQKGYKKELIQNTIKQIKINEYKRKQPEIADIDQILNKRTPLYIK